MPEKPFSRSTAASRKERADHRDQGRNAPAYAHPAHASRSPPPEQVAPFRTRHVLACSVGEPGHLAAERPVEGRRAGRTSMLKLGVWSLWRSRVWNSETHSSGNPPLRFGGRISSAELGERSRWLPNHRFTHDTGTSTISATLAAGRNYLPRCAAQEVQQQTPNTRRHAGQGPEDRVDEGVSTPPVLGDGAHTLSDAWPFTILYPRDPA